MDRPGKFRPDEDSKSWIQSNPSKIEVLVTIQQKLAYWIETILSFFPLYPIILIF